ncbi:MULTISPECIES: WhiB family transcriptional regulator [unclassified Nocardioides]|uniref:WhiB family transcriptional regulator n=1 Tax=unclassified Nocardioides TaxID=2615069 RepID=UPI00138F9208
MYRAACIGAEPDRFFSSGRGGRVSLRGLPCGTCPVRAECREFAEGRSLVGVWGGRSFG